MMSTLALLALSGCQGTGALPSTMEASTRPPLTLTVDSPVPGTFAGDAPVRVAGTVTDPEALVWVDGHRVNVGANGHFQVDVPVLGDYRLIDVEAAAPQTHLREHLVVLGGSDPMDSWPGAISLRFGPTGLDHLAELFQQAVVDLELAAQVEALLPELTLGGVVFTPTGVENGPLWVSLEPTESGLLLSATTHEVSLGYDFTTATGVFHLGVGIQEMTLGATSAVRIDPDGVLIFELSDTTVDLSDPILDLGGLGLPWFDALLGGATAGLGDLIEGAFDGILSLLTTIPITGPIQLEMDLLGTPVAFSLDTLDTDLEGIGSVLAVDLGQGTGEGVRVPSAHEIGRRADLGVAVHEGVLQPLLQSDLLDMLNQDLVLPGLLGEAIGLPVVALPGGAGAPADRTGWCMAIDPGVPRVVRLNEGFAPMATVMLPDLTLDIGVSTPEGACQDWLKASLAVEADLVLTEGTVLGVELRVTGGAVEDYATELPWEEAEVIDGLGGLLDVATLLLGGAVEFDLADLFATTADTGLLGDLQPRLISNTKVRNESGEPIDGLYLLTVSLWE